jgi:hypothetical protein
MTKRVFQNKKIMYKGLIILFLLIAPWFNGIFSDVPDPQKLVQEDMSFYEVNVCKISLVEFLINDPSSIFQDHYHFRYNNYSAVSCFGKISGATLLNNEFYISIGTNSFVNIVIQLTVWTLFFSLITKEQNKLKFSNYLNYIASLMTASIFTLLIFAEKTYYAKQFYLLDMEDKSSYLYIFSILFLLTVFLSEVIMIRLSSVSNYLPFIFLFLGVFSGFNISIYSIILTNFGFYSFLNKRLNIKFNLLMIFFSCIWISNAQGRFSFDPDKLRGFTSTSYEFMTILASSLFFIIFINGIIYFLQNTRGYFNLRIFNSNLLITGFYVIILGIIGSNFPILNFFNYYYFGQQKYGITLNNPFAFDQYGLKIPWRGFYPSAESIGEFFGLVLFFSIVHFLKNKSKISKIDIFYLVSISFGLYFTNNRSVILLIMLIMLIFLRDKIIKSKILFIATLLLSTIFIILTIGLQNVTYPYSFSSGYLLELANKYTDGYQLSEGLKFANQLNTNGGVGSILFNLFSFIAFYLNRSQIWAYSLGRYNPNISEVLFGSGPYNFAKHYAEINLLPETLLLPHSTVLSYLLFFGLFGLLGFFFLLFYNIYINKTKLNYFGYALIIYLLLNIIKNDSMLYPSGIIFYTYLLYTTFTETKENIFKV